MSIPATPWGRRVPPDPSWVAVDEYTLSHVHPPTKPNTSVLEHAVTNSLAKGLPPIQSCPVQSKFIALQCKMSNVKHVLEVGTLGGYTPIWIATENPSIRVTSVEINARNAAVARENIENAGVSDRVTVVEGAAEDVLKGFLKDVQKGERERFGMVFIDADKGNNWTYFDLAVKMAYPGACIMVDNTVINGDLVRDELLGTDHVKGARKVIEMAGADERVDSVVMQIVSQQSRDGFLMAVVR